jgi:polyisoprenoid-binding protein YceI
MSGPTSSPSPKRLLSLRAIPVRLSMLVAATALVLAACASSPDGTNASAARPWEVDLQGSSLSFITTKAGAAGVGGIAEVSRFKRFSGGMDVSGKVTLNVDLASVDTGIEIRDDRLRTLLWNVKATPQAVFSAQLPANVVQQAGAAGQPIEVQGELRLVGQAKPVSASLNVTRVAGDKLLVTTRNPVVINSNDFGLRDGVEALRASVGLNFLSSSAPVHISLLLNAKGG